MYNINIKIKLGVNLGWDLDHRQRKSTRVNL
jgi:hypothetical protein